MYWIFLLTLVHAGPRKKERNKRPPVAAITEAETRGPLAPTGIPVDPNILPALEGQDASLDLQGLTRSALRFTFELDISVLGEIQIESRGTLARHLAADPGWRVTQRRGLLLAEKRQATSVGPTVGLGGYHISADQCWRVAVRLGDAPPNGAWNQFPPVVQITDQTKLIDLWAYGLKRQPCLGQQALALTASGPGVALEILDSGDGSDMPHILHTLGPGILNLYTQGSSPERVDAEGYEARALTLPFDPPHPPTLVRIEERVDFRAWVNPGQNGMTWLRLLVDGEPLYESDVANSTYERPGWSLDETRLFPIQSRLNLPPGPEMTALAQLWFQDESQNSRILWQGTLQLPARPQ